jgi:two-component sensor histidine kinase
MNGVATEGELDWVLVLAPFRKDADYIAAFLHEQKIEAKSAKVDDDLEKQLARSPGMIVVTHEALSPGVVARIAGHLAVQQDWSEVPIFVLLERAADIAKIRGHLLHAWPGCRLLFHTRPIARLEFVNGIQSNLLVRLRQRQVRDSIERERELRLELNHRVKNILASVTSIFRMTCRGAAAVEDLASDFTGRLQALSNVHTAAFEAGGEKVSLSAVLERTVSPYLSAGKKRIHIECPDVMVSSQAGTTIALCLHELITNAIKYGALSHTDGEVSIVFSIAQSPDPVLSLDWVETGGPVVHEPTRQGYGTRYVRSALGSLLAATPLMTFAEDGFRCSAQGLLSRVAPPETGLGAGTEICRLKPGNGLE